ncbi:hypothetical protein Tco_1436804, partial [Tanacetum coccineum]
SYSKIRLLQEGVRTSSYVSVVTMGEECGFCTWDIWNDLLTKQQYNVHGTGQHGRNLEAFCIHLLATPHKGTRCNHQWRSQDLRI